MGGKESKTSSTDNSNSIIGQVGQIIGQKQSSNNSSEKSKDKSVTTSVDVETNTITKNEIDVLNEYINETITNNIIESAKKCTSTVYGEQKVTISNVTAEGDIEIGGEQEQDFAISFECVQSSDVRSETSIDLVNKIIEQLKASNDTKVLDKLNEIAKTKLETTENIETPGKYLPDLAKLGDDVSSDTEIRNKTTVQNESLTSLKNIVKNSVINNFSTKDVSEFVGKVGLSQVTKYDTITSRTGKVVLRYGQKQASNVILKTVQDSKVSNNIVNTIMNGLDLKTDTEVKTDLQKDTTIETETEKKTDKNIKVLADPEKSSDNTMMWVLIIGGIIVAIIIIIIIIQIMKKKKANKAVTSASAVSSANSTGAPVNPVASAVVGTALKTASVNPLTSAVIGTALETANTNPVAKAAIDSAIKSTGVNPELAKAVVDTAIKTQTGGFYRRW